MSRAPLRLIALLSAGLAVVVAAPAPHAAAAPAPAAPAFAVPKPVERELKNKLEVDVVEDHRLPRVHVRVEVRSGAADDAAEKAGLANLMLLTLRQGSEQRDATTLARDLDGMGAAIGVATGRDQMVLTGQFLTRDWKTGLDILAELMLHPAFRKEELERQRSQVLGAREASRDQNADVASEHANALVYGAHPYARPTEGEAASISGLTREDVVAFHQATFRPNNTIIIVVGDVDANEAHAEIEARFKDWTRADVAARAAAPPSGVDSTRVRLLDKPGVSQTEIVMGLPGVPRSTPDYFAIQLMNYVLGGGGFSSRLVQNARVKSGLTYGASTTFAMNQDAGAFFLSTSTKNASVGAMLDICRATLRDFRAQGPTAKELADAKRFVVGSLPMTVQTAAQVANQWAVVRRNGLGSDYFDRFAEVGSSRVDLQACKLEYSIVSPK